MMIGNPLTCKRCGKICRGGQGLAAHLRAHGRPRKKFRSKPGPKPGKRKYTRRKDIGTVARELVREHSVTPESISRSLIINTIQTLLEALR